METRLSRRECLVMAVGVASWWAYPKAQHVGGAAAAAGQRAKIVVACNKYWADNKGDCSGFVRAVASDLGFQLTGNANAIYEQIKKDPWVSIGVGKDASVVAGASASEGKFVVAARQDKPNGHVAVVVDYRNAFDSYNEVDRKKAVATWGSLNSVGQEYQRITLSWSASDLQTVFYAYREVS